MTEKYVLREAVHDVITDTDGYAFGSSAHEGEYVI
jgi:hypothetical protein